MDRESTCHKILIKSDTFCEKKDKADDSIIIVEKNKEQIKEIITSCLEEPLHLMLQEWLEVLKTKCSSRLASGLIAEIEAIQKQMESCTIKDREVFQVLRSAGAGSIVPDNIINFLFRYLFVSYSQNQNVKLNLNGRCFPLFCIYIYKNVVK